MVIVTPSLQLLPHGLTITNFIQYELNNIACLYLPQLLQYRRKYLINTISLWPYWPLPRAQSPEQEDHEFHTFGKRLHRHPNHAFSFLKCISGKRRFHELLLYGNISPTLGPGPLTQGHEFHNFRRELARDIQCIQQKQKNKEEQRKHIHFCFQMM